MYGRKSTQTGISLFIVMIVVLLTAILVALGFRSSQFNETVTGNTAEYQRVFEAAQAIAHDAEMDIMRLTATGSPCTGTGCRQYGVIDEATAKIYFPLQTELQDVQIALRYATKNCIAGICEARPDAEQYWKDLWDDAAELNAMKARAARYGQYTKGIIGQGTNPRLTNGWYWVELLDYDMASAIVGGGTAYAPTDGLDIIYRITAMVEGARNTRAVIQKIVVGKK